MHLLSIPKKLLLILNICLLLVSLSMPSCNLNKTSEDNEKPEDNRFTKVVLAQGFDEPMEMTFLKDGHILIVERKGQLKSFNTKTNQVKLVANIPVNTKYISKEGAVTDAEEGLMGIVAHPDFDKNHWIYLYYADPNEKKHVLARWEFRDDSLYASTKKILMEIPTQREVCCHTGGGMAFDLEGNLLLTVGNNTANPESGTASYDERTGRSSWDDQRGSGNTNDLRGKILRIHPENDGSYTVPEGNLFPKGTPKTRPEIFIMGDRNPWRISVDSKTGYIYWGEVGPDAVVDSVYGSRGYDEFNQARKAGFFGWPYFIGDNKPYVKYNYADSTYGETFNPAHPVNNSPNNTGLKELPPAQKAFIWYPYGTSDTFPLVGSSGRCAIGGPVFHKDNFKNASRPWPSYFEDKWLITDFMQGWIMAVSMDKGGNYKSMEQLLPNENFSSVIDMQFSPDGDLYLLEYGTAWFRGNPNSALVRIEYNGGNRKPIVEASADKMAGAVPFKVNLSSKGTIDYDKYDKDALKYEWRIKGNGMDKTLTESDPAITFDKPGVYDVTLTVTDTKGEQNSKSLKLTAGNEPPSVAVNILKGNKTFFFPNEPIEYSIEVNDKEDGSIADGKIRPGLVTVNFDYVPEGFDPVEIAQHHNTAGDQAGFSAGSYLINSNDCKSCHMMDKISVGPSFMDVASKYKNDDSAISRLAGKVISGGSGVWGEHAMAAHPNLSRDDAQRIVKYILSLSQKQAIEKTLLLNGRYITKIPAGENGRGGYLLRAAYTDKGSGAIEPLSSESIVALRSVAVDPQKADIKKNTQLLTTPDIIFSMLGDNSYLGYNNIDLGGIKQIQVLVLAMPSSGDVGGMIEIHLDSANGKQIGQTEMVEPKEIDFDKIMANFFSKSKMEKGSGAKTSASQQNQITPADIDELKKQILPHAIAAIAAVEGMHNVYFVFKNSRAAANQLLMQVIEIDFGKMAVSTPVVKPGKIMK
ncbi:MAG: PQQ-dependent sugar dehydrogenase [Chitinophagales bacterium]